MAISPIDPINRLTASTGQLETADMMTPLPDNTPEAVEPINPAEPETEPLPADPPDTVPPGAFLANAVVTSPRAGKSVLNVAGVDNTDNTNQGISGQLKVVPRAQPSDSPTKRTLGISGTLNQAGEQAEPLTDISGAVTLSPNSGNNSATVTGTVVATPAASPRYAALDVEENVLNAPATRLPDKLSVAADTSNPTQLTGEVRMTPVTESTATVSGQVTMLKSPENPLRAGTENTMVSTNPATTPNAPRPEPTGILANTLPPDVTPLPSTSSTGAAVLPEAMAAAPPNATAPLPGTVPALTTSPVPTGVTYPQPTPTVTVSADTTPVNVPLPVTPSTGFTPPAATVDTANFTADDATLTGLPQPILTPPGSTASAASELTRAYMSRSFVTEQMTDLPEPAGITDFSRTDPEPVLRPVLHEASPFTQMDYNKTWTVSAEALETLLKRINPNGQVTLKALRRYEATSAEDVAMLGYLRQLPIFTALAHLDNHDNTLAVDDIHIMMQRHMLVVADVQLSIFITP
jgi:hypothetical protein